jgi:hypothetical protein
MALISAWRIEASQVFCDLFIIPKEWMMAMLVLMQKWWQIVKSFPRAQS